MMAFQSASPDLQSVHSDGNDENPYSNNWNLLDQQRRPAESGDVGNATNNVESKKENTTSNYINEPNIQATLITQPSKIDGAKDNIQPSVNIQADFSDRKEQEERYKQLERVKEDLELKNHELLSSVTFSAQRIKDLATQIKTKDEEISKLKVLDSQNTILIKKMKTDFQTLQDDVMKVRAEACSVSNIMTEVMNFEGVNKQDSNIELVAEYKFQIEKLNDECSCRDKKLRLAEEKEKSLNTTIIDLNGKLCAEEAHVKQLKAEILILETEKFSEADLQNIEAQQLLLKKLKLQLQNMRKQNEDKIKRCMELESSLKKQTSLTNDKAKEVDDKQKQINNLKRQVLVKATRIKDLEKVIEEKNCTISSTSNKLSEFEKKFKSSEDVRKKIIDELNVKNDELQSCKILLSRLSHEEKEAKNDYHKHSSSLQSDLEDMKQKCDMKDAQIQSLTKSLSDLSKEMTSYQKEILLSKAQIHHSPLDFKENQSLQQQLNAEVARSERLESQLERVHNELRVKNEESKSYLSKIDRLKKVGSLDEFKKKSALKTKMIQEELEKSRLILEEQVHSMEALKKFKDSMERNFDLKCQEVLQLNEINETLKKEIESYKDASEVNEKSIGKLQENLRILKRLLKAKDHEKKEVTDKLNGVIIEKNFIEKHYEDLKNRSRASQDGAKANQHASSISNMTHLLDFVQKCNRDLENKTESFLKLQNEHQKLKEEYNRLKLSYDVKLKENCDGEYSARHLDKRLKEAYREIKQLNLIVEERQFELAEKSRMVDGMNDFMKKNEVENATTHSELRTAKKQVLHYSELLQEKTTEIKLLKTGIDDMKQKLGDCNGNASRDNAELIALRNILEMQALKAHSLENSATNNRILEGTINNLKNRLATSTAELTAVTKRLNEIMQEHQKTKFLLMVSQRDHEFDKLELKNKIDLLQKEKIENQTLLLDVSRLKKDFKESEMQKTDKNKKSMELQIADLKNTVKTLTSQRDELMQQLNRKMAEHETLKEHIKKCIQKSGKQATNLDIESHLSHLILESVKMIDSSGEADQQQVANWITSVNGHDNNSNLCEIKSHENIHSKTPSDNFLEEKDLKSNEVKEKIDVVSDKCDTSDDNFHCLQPDFQDDFKNAAEILKRVDELLNSKQNRIDITGDQSAGDTLANDTSLSIGSVTASIMSNLGAEDSVENH